MTRHVVVGTAGHIDHGKTSLVKALTGIDTDRLPEEKARGITIDLGFAFLEEPGGLTIEIVDVPGHERFVKNMLAGVGGIDLAMLVIAADEGVMPQTREHLAICSLLRIRGGLVALTKTDLVEPDWLELVRDDVATLVRATFLQGAPIVPVSAKTGAGLPELRQALRRLAESVPERAVDQLARLPIDRVFTVKGFGTVVTGTLAAGRLAVDDRVEVYPKGVEAKVRGLQTHGHPVAEARAGQRTAVNLQGVERAALERGDVLAHAGTLVPAVLVDGTLELLPDAPRGLKTRTRVRFHAGTSEIMARVLLLDRAELAPGETVFASFRLEAPLVALPSDRFVVRSYSPIVTIGGGTLLDVDPPRFKRKAPALVAHLTLLQTGGPEVVLEEHVRHVGAAGVRLAALSGRVPFGPERLRGLLDALVAAGRVLVVDRDWFLHPESGSRLRALVVGALAAFHRAQLCGEAEVHQHGCPVRSNDDVRRRQVAEHEALPMEEGQGRAQPAIERERPRQVRRFADPRRTPRAPDVVVVFAERPARKQLHRVPRHPLAQPFVHDFHDAGVIDAPERQDLAAKARNGALGRKTHGLQRHAPSRLRMLGSVHDPHATSAEHPTNPIRADALRRRNVVDRAAA